MTAEVPLDNPCKRLGDLLVEEGIITEGQLRESLAKREVEGGFIGKIMMELGYLSEQVLTSFLVKQFKIPHISLLDYEISNEMIASLPRELCIKHNLLPIDRLGRILTIAMVDPLDTEALDAVQAACPELRIKPILCDWRHFELVIRRTFSGDGPPVEAAADGEMTMDSLGLSGSAAAPRKKKAPAAKQPAAPVDKKSGESPVTLVETIPISPRDGGDRQVSNSPREAATRPAHRDDVSADVESTAKFVELIETSVRSTVQNALDKVSLEIQGLLLSSSQDLALSGPQLAEHIRKAIRESLEDAAGKLIYETQQALERSRTESSALSTQQLSELLRLSMRLAIEDASNEILAKAARAFSGKDGLS
ncbi:MAG: hypothetical protein IIB38_01080 [Candidatus Hydrogenedentes bacterium]|nr:hypothetical protein [Candidatus Hydrogenedentota bacterium]